MYISQNHVTYVPRFRTASAPLAIASTPARPSPNVRPTFRVHAWDDRRPPPPPGPPLDGRCCFLDAVSTRVVRSVFARSLSLVLQGYPGASHVGLAFCTRRIVICSTGRFGANAGLSRFLSGDPRHKKVFTAIRSGLLLSMLLLTAANLALLVFSNYGFFPASQDFWPLPSYLDIKHVFRKCKENGSDIYVFAKLYLENRQNIGASVIGGHQLWRLRPPYTRLSHTEQTGCVIQSNPNPPN
jgi:hypothetical protein